MLRTTGSLPTETLSYEPFEGVGSDGQSSYGDALSFEANVLEYDAAQFSQGAQFIVEDDGSRVRIPLTLYVQGTATNIPDEGDRVARDGRSFIVAERAPVSGLRHLPEAPDHYRLRCRDE